MKSQDVLQKEIPVHFQKIAWFKKDALMKWINLFLQEMYIWIYHFGTSSRGRFAAAI